MPDDPNTCRHIAQLSPIPGAQEVKTLQKGMRTRKAPDVSADFFGSHVKLGAFQFFEEDGRLLVEWSIPKKKTKRAAFIDLCTNSALQPERLQLGWLIMRMHELDRIHQCEQIPDPREMMQIINYFAARERHWTHWSIAPVEKIRVLQRQ